MPRDLFADRHTLDEMPQLTREPASDAPPQDSSLVPHRDSDIAKQQRFKQMGNVHPFVQLLNSGDIDDCDWLEHAVFDAIEAASRGKLEYRLATCGELCSGLFSSAYATSSGPLGDIIKTRTFQPIDASDSDRKRILLGHIIATKSAAPVVTDESMDYAKDYQTNYQLAPSIGHNEDGQTVCIHSLAVHPNFAGKGLGQVLLKSYIQRIRDSQVGKRIALICRDRLVKFYQKAGFRKVGPSKCQFGGGNWVDMVLDFEEGHGDDEPDY